MLWNWRAVLQFWSMFSKSMSRYLWPLLESTLWNWRAVRYHDLLFGFEARSLRACLEIYGPIFVAALGEHALILNNGHWSRLTLQLWSTLSECMSRDLWQSMLWNWRAVIDQDLLFSFETLPPRACLDIYGRSWRSYYETEECSLVMTSSSALKHALWKCV
jgi:hypothetical protein